MNLETEIVSQFKALAKGAKLSPRERAILAEIAADAALLYANASSGLWNAAAVAREKRQLDAQIAALKSISGARAVKLFWRAFNLAVGVVVKVVLTA